MLSNMDKFFKELKVGDSLIISTKTDGGMWQSINITNKNNK